MGVGAGTAEQLEKDTDYTEVQSSPEEIRGERVKHTEGRF